MNNQPKPIIAVVAIIVIALALEGWNHLNSAPIASQRPLVVTSFYPLAQFAQAVGHELIDVKSITPSGVEPHDFEPTARDIQELQKAQLFIYNGAGLDEWAARAAGARTSGRSLSMVQELTQRGLLEKKNNDPHVWLDPVLAQEQVLAIRDALIALDLSHATQYNSNTQEYIQRLRSLDQQFRTGLSQCPRKEIIVSHDAFGYLAKRYGITIHAIAGMSPDQEPSARTLAQLATLARLRKITTIFFEELVSPRLAQTLAREVGAHVDVLNPIEGLTEDQQQQGKNYLSIMEENLNHLRDALSCT